MYAEIKSEISKLLAKAADVAEEEALASLELPKAEFGDLACTLAFSLAKREKKNPTQIAGEIAGKIPKHELVEKVEAKGPYINFFFSDAVYERILRSELKPLKKRKEKILIEFPSVNPNKPLHVGHLRNALLGDSVARILEFAGYNVERENYINDLGLQVAESFWGYLHSGKKIEGKADLWLGKQYVEVAKKIENKKVEREVREILKRMEQGGNETARKARELAEMCVRAQYETAFNYNIFHDLLVWESDLVRERIFEKAFERMLGKKAIVKETEGENAGCVVAKLGGIEEFKEMEKPDKVLLRSDGTATYTGRDVAFQMWKLGIIIAKLKCREFLKQPNGQTLYTTAETGVEMYFGRADKAINVIGAEQIYPQKVISHILRLMGYEREAKNSIHLAYEHVGLGEEKFSGRMGTWIGYTADELLQEGKKRTLEKIKELEKMREEVGRKEERSEKEREKIVNAVAVGAIRFSFLRTSPEKKILFKWEEALSLEGDSAPYLMYAHTRCAGILEKAKEKGIKIGNVKGYSYTHEERALLKLLAQFSEVVGMAARDYRPHYIADYLLELAASFNKFYHTLPVLSAKEENARSARLEIVRKAKEILRAGLELLGIEAIERM